MENKIGRLAGLTYLVVVLTGIFSLAYVPAQINVPGNIAATLDNIAASESLFRYGIASFLVNQVAFLILPLIFFRLFGQTNRSVAVVMLTLAVVSVPIALTSLVSRLDALVLLTNDNYKSAIPAEHVRAAAALYLDAYRSGLLVTNLFWGLWLLPLGYLVLTSRLLPQVLGVVLMLGGVGYTIHVFGHLLIAGYSDTLLARHALKPAAVGEIGTCLWLLLVGVREPKRTRA